MLVYYCCLKRKSYICSQYQNIRLIDIIEMKIKTFEFNPLGVNTYVLYVEADKNGGGDCIVIDAACIFPEENDELISFIESNNLTVKRLINTHLHFDHIFGVNVLAEKYNLKLEAHKDDLFLLDSLEQQMKMFGFNTGREYKPEVGNLLTDQDTIKLGDQEMSILHVPGHSPGSLVFYNEEENFAIVGDVLFNGSIGRTDLVGGDFDLLIGGIQSKLFLLPDDTTVYPGHGPSTTIGREKKSNPFVGSRI